MRSTTIAKGAALIMGAAALTATLVLPSSADPAQPVAATDITAVGSDTIQFLDDDLATAYNATTPAPSQLFDSWDAVNPTTGAAHDNITIKPGVTIVRPNGSNEGIAALLSNNGNNSVDVARSSRGPQSGDQGLAFLPVAQDELRYAVATTTNAPLNLTAAQLATIYSCGAPGNSTSTWNNLGGTSTDAVKAVIPQPGSGTRTFFEKQINVTDAVVQAGVTAGCITQVEEHDPAGIAGDPDKIGPFSVARFKTKAANSGIQLNTSGFDAFREVYNVVRIDPTSGGVPSALQPLLGDGATNFGWVCSTAGQNVVKADGFNTLSNCGVAETYNG